MTFRRRIAAISVCKTAHRARITIGERTNITDTERKVIDILVGRGNVKDVWDEPIHEVDRAMRWDTQRIKEFVKDLVSRGLVHHEWSAVGQLHFDPPGECWKEEAAC